MENTAPQPPKNNNVFLGIGLFIAFLFIVYFLFFKTANTATIDPKTGKTVDPKKDDTKKDEPKVDDKPPPPASCGNGTWKRKAVSTDKFTMPTDAEREAYLKVVLKKMDLLSISYATAFLKGMDLSLSWSNIELYQPEFADFVSREAQKVKAARRPNFADEIRNYPFQPGDLVCGRTTFTQFGLS